MGEMGVLFCMRVHTEYANEESAAWKSNAGQTAEDPHSPRKHLGSPKGVVSGTNMFVSHEGEVDSEYS